MPENVERRVKSVGAILMNADGKILLQQRDNNPELNFPGHWTTFGGRVEDGEQPDDAMRRELLEEIELEVPVKLWKVYDHRTFFKGLWTVVEQYVYVGRINRAICDIPLHEGQAVGYFGLPDIDNLPIAFGFENLFKEFFAAFAGGLDI